MLNEYYYKRTIKRVLTNIEVEAYFQNLLLIWWTIRCVAGAYRNIKSKEEKLHYIQYLTTVNETNLAKAMLFDLFGVTNCDTTRHHLNKRKSNTVNPCKHMNIFCKRYQNVTLTLGKRYSQRQANVFCRLRYTLRKRSPTMFRLNVATTFIHFSYNFHKGENKL